MSKYHINENGDPGKCSAMPGNCPYGDDVNHFNSMEAARINFEKQMTESEGSTKVDAEMITVPYFVKDAIKSESKVRIVDRDSFEPWSATEGKYRNGVHSYKPRKVN